MVSFLFELNNDNDEVHEFGMGHMTIICGENIFTSEEHIPNQSMMIFISIQMLMHSVREILASKNCKKSEFGAVDSSFSIVFMKYKNNEIGLIYGDKLFCKIDSKKLASSLWEASNSFYDRYLNKITGSGAVLEDWEKTKSKFKEILAIR